MSYKLVLVFLAIVLGVGGLAYSASAQTTGGPTKVIVGFSQGASAYWEGTGANEGERIFENFSLSGGWDFENYHYPQSPGTTTWRTNAFWWSYSKVSCPAVGSGYCSVIEQDYGPAIADDFHFYNDVEVTFSSRGYSFSFIANRSLGRDFTQDVKNHQQANGSSCWYEWQNSMRHGSAILTLPNSQTLSGTTTNGSAWYDWRVESGRGVEFFIPSCAPYSGGGKG